MRNRSRSYRRPNLGLIEQTTTIYKDRTEYLIRAHLELGPPPALYPLEITEIVPIARKEQSRWRFPAGSVKLPAISTGDNFRECDTFIKNWAAGFLAAEGKIHDQIARGG